MRDIRASRHTVREALRGLVERGLIERRQGAGSIVVSLAAPPAFAHSVKSLSELWSYARATKIIVQNAAVTALTAEEAATVGIPVWQSLAENRGRAMDRQRGRDRVLAHALCTRAICTNPQRPRAEQRPRLFHHRGKDRRESGRGGAGDLGLRHAEGGRCQAERRKGEPALMVVRRYLDASGSAMLVALSIHPGDSFTHTLRLRREDEAA